MMFQTLDHFCHVLQETEISQNIQKIGWLIPVVQTIHILAIAAVISSALVFHFRLIGLIDRDQSLATVGARFLPVIWVALLILLTTGTILIIGEPARSLENPVFLLKMTLLVVAILVTAGLQVNLGKVPSFWELSSASRIGAKIVAIFSLLLWVAIICAGRWIAYVQID